MGSVERFGGGQEGSSPSIFFSVFVGRIDKVFGDYAAVHFQMSYVAVKETAHFRTDESAGCAEIASDHAAVAFEGG